MLQNDSAISGLPHFMHFIEFHYLVLSAFLLYLVKDDVESTSEDIASVFFLNLCFVNALIIIARLHI